MPFQKSYIMKNKYLTMVCFFCFCFTYSQEKEQNEIRGTILRVESNGVVVYKPVDVEQTLGIKPELAPVVEERSNSPRTIDDYSLEELEEMLYYVDLKIDNVGTDRVNNYTEQRSLIEKKIQSIKESN